MSSGSPSEIRRREALALLGSPWVPAALSAAAGVAPGVAAAAAEMGVRTDQITVLYRPATQDAPSRMDPHVQVAIRELERLFIANRYKVLQPSAEVYRLMDQGQGVVVTFAADAGFSLIFSAFKTLRPDLRQDGSIAELRLESRVVVGRNVLSAEDARGMMFTRTDGSNREYGERLALEAAAKKAAQELVDKTVAQIGTLTPASIAQMLGPQAAATTQAEVVYVPPSGGVEKPPEPPPLLPPSPSAPGPAPAAPAPAVPVPPAPPQPVPAPVPAPEPPRPSPSTTPAPAPVAPLPQPRQRWALVVGMSDYASVRANGQKGMTDLPGVGRDVTKVQRSLQKLGFDAAHTTVLRDGQATSKAVRDVMRRFAGTVQPDDLVLLFISSHGGDKEYSTSGFGMPILADYGLQEASTLDFWELQSFARNLKARVVWISDTCHSGGAAQNITSVVVSGSGVQAASDVRGPDALEVARQAGAGQDFAILTASSPQEISWETGEGGLFTTRLFAALEQAPDRPLAETFAEHVQRFVVSESKKICARANACSEHPQQTPIMAFGGAGNRIRV